MKKPISFFVKLIVLVVLILQISLSSYSYADIADPNWQRVAESRKTWEEYVLLNKDITKKIDTFNELKNPNSIEKELFKKDFKALLIKCVELKDKANSEQKRRKNRKAKKTKKLRKGFNSYLIKIAEARENNEVDEKRLKELLTQLGVNDFSFIEKKKRLYNNLFTLSGFAILLLLIGFSFLRYIRIKKQIIKNIEEG